jgi:ribonucleoside-triphosphate reductase
MLEHIETTTTSKTLNNLKRSLKDSLRTKYNVDSEEIINNFLFIHGIHKDQFDFIKRTEEIINSRLNDASIDDNSNKNEKTIKGIMKEVSSSIDKAVGFDYLYREMKDLYGKGEANRLMGEMLDLSLGISDSVNLMLPYCYALDASKLVTIGRDFGQLHSKPCKRLTSYISALCEMVHQMSSHLAGAVAIGTFFKDVSHILLYNENVDYETLKNDTSIRKYIENEFQQFVHSVNHLSRNSAESPFSNVSVFDRVKLATFLDDSNMGWYFPVPEGYAGSKEEWIKYVIEYIIEVQDLFLDFFDKGIPLKNGAPYRYPVVTCNLSKKENGDTKVVDMKFFRKLCKRDIFRYNIFTSEGTKISSCCRLQSDAEMLDLASQSNSFGGTSISLGSHRVVTINFNRIALECDSIETYYYILNNRILDAGKVLKAHKMLIQNLTKSGLQSFIKNGWINMNRLFSTFGLLGIYEANKTLRNKFKFKKEDDIVKDILVFFNNKVSEISKELGIIGNIEQIPGESFAIRLSTADKLIYGSDKVPHELYANQFVPLWENATLWEKFDVDGKYNQLLTGGGIVHAQIGEKVTSKQAEKIIMYAINSGCEHFALNGVFSECIDGHISFGKLTKCSHCGKDIVEHYTRVVGFFTPVTSWNKTRREWEFPRRTFIDLPDDSIL